VRQNQDRLSLSVRGRLDLMLKHAGRRTIVDFKTANDFAFSKVKEDDWTTINEQYIGQLGAYGCAWIDTTNLDALTDFLVVYENKDNGKLKYVWIPMDEALAAGERARENLTKVVRAIANGTADQVEPGYGPDEKGELPWFCRYCDVVETCWKKHGLRRKDSPKSRKPYYYVEVK